MRRIALLAAGIGGLVFLGEGAAADGARLRVISYNIYLGKALRAERSASDEVKPLLSIARLLGRHPSLRGFDVLGLQEVCSGEAGWQLEYFDRLLREQYGVSWMHFGRSDEFGSQMCERGEAVFSRHPIVAGGRIRLPNIKEERSAIWADIETPHGPLRVYNAHLENNPKGRGDANGRWLQTTVILRHLLAWRKEHPGVPLILLGDLNTTGGLLTPWRRERTITELSKILESAINRYVPTFIFPPFQLDWIFQDGLATAGARVIHTHLSDHYPVVADLEPLL